MQPIQTDLLETKPNQDNASSLSLCNPFTLPTLSVWHRTKLLRYAKQVLQAQHHIQNSHTSILHQTLEYADRHKSMDHYPRGDRIDQRTGGQYFYHCHRENFTTTEHGHFHCFLRQTSIPKHYVRLPNTNWCPKNAMTHLAAIGMNQLGQPIRLFTVNRWVTDDTWYDAKYIRHFIKRFQFEINDTTLWQPIDRWIEGIIHLFAPHIQWLHQQRDLFLQSTLTSAEACSENRALEELSSIDINLEQHIQWIIDSKPHGTAS